VGKNRVARLMRQHGIIGVTCRRGPATTARAPGTPQGPDLVEREFAADRPDKLWVADITYVPTGSGFQYLAVVLDVFSRRIVGWAMAGHLRTELVLAALDMAVAQRMPEGVVHHSDHGSQNPDSTGRRNSVCGMQDLVHPFGRRSPAQRLARTSVER
jgi:putative transposase